ncbi:hypothetical protein PHMEG_0004527 [Phytophthora megakarya]|uniref:Tyr recombinase domain-containing protein n=1 Tax=Phytophthora megakarya TaxID=4795 RepID=A0A225WVT6_9STRA|nr:hypothetical protein PHMEG_0004527 [Phytophthora megakarya]
MDASDSGIWAIIRAESTALTYVLNNAERDLIRNTKDNPTIDFDINYRELLSCALAIHTWGASWAVRSRSSANAPPVHKKMASRNPRAQTVIRLLGIWEVKYNLRFPSSHIAGHCFKRSETDLAFHLRAPSIAVTTYHQYLKSPRKWHDGCVRRGISPTLNAISPAGQILHITEFILRGFHDGNGSGHRVRSTNISATLTGIRHFFTAAGIEFPCGHPQIRMLQNGIHRLDSPVQHKASVSILILELCFASLNIELPSDQALWGGPVPGLLLPTSSIRDRFKGRENARVVCTKANEIAILDAVGKPTISACRAVEVHIRLSGSKTNQHGDPTLRALNRSGHQFLCPVFGAACVLNSRRSLLPPNIPAAVYMTEHNRPVCVSATRLSRTIRQAATRAGEQPSKFSAHSLRAGGATHMYRAENNNLTIQFHGRWVSDTFKQYTRLCKESVTTLASDIVSGSCQRILSASRALLQSTGWGRSTDPFRDHVKG